MTQQKSSKVDKLYESIEQGRLGKNRGYSTGLDGMDDITTGNHAGTFYLIAGPTGSGKSTLAIYSYIYAPLMYENLLGSDKYKIIYFSLEMNSEILLAKLLCMYLADQMGIEISYNEVLSRRDVLPDDLYDKVLEGRAWIEQVAQHLIIFDRELTSKGLEIFLEGYSKRIGTWESTTNEETFTPYNPDAYYGIVVDHLGLLKTLPGQDKKAAMDAACQVLIRFRNKCKMSPIAVMQTNRSASSMDRRMEHMQDPELSDLKGSGDPAEAAEVVLSLFYPTREKMATWKDFNLKVLGDSFRALFCLKGRFGDANLAKPLMFFGRSGIFKELPKDPKMVNEKAAFFKSLTHFNKGIDLDDTSNQDETEDEDDNTNYQFVIG